MHPLMLLGLSALQLLRGAQLPLRLPPVQNPDSQWQDLNARPDANWTGNLIFDTVNSFLQHWPNTRYRNGHNVVPATVPVNTLLYHGRDDDKLPAVPEWTSTDPEHSWPFCSAPPTNESITGCWQLTLVTSRPLKVLYFDGSSAANIQEGGPMDAQDLLIWGEVNPERWVDERDRIDDLCMWGKEFGIDGYLRMEMDFEIMLCDFSSNGGVELLAADYLAAWRAQISSPPGRPKAPAAVYSQDPRGVEMIAPDPGGFPVADLLRFETVHAGSWHNRYPGDTRIVLDLSRLISFYDTSLAPSLIPSRAGQQRWDHRLHNISASDLVAVKTRLEEALTSKDNAGSGIDWQTLYHVIVDRYADRLELLQYLLNTTNSLNIHDRARIMQTQLRIILAPYIPFTARPVPVNASTTSSNDSWANPVWQACATRHTAYIHGRSTLKSQLTASELVLLRALDETTREICRVLTRMWVHGVHAGLDPLILLDPASTPSAHISSVVDAWRMEVRELMNWLDWSVWVKCRPTCGPEELCYLPTWPWFYNRDSPNDAWKRPQPRCIRRFGPYSPLQAA